MTSNLKDFFEENPFKVVALAEIDGLTTFITQIRNNIAKGFVIYSFTEPPVSCFIIKEKGVYAHGKSIKSAYKALQAKLYNTETEEKRIQEFIKEFPKYTKAYNNNDLFEAHHKLTGSCLFGRKFFIKSHNISMEDKTTIKDFIELVKNSYGATIIYKLKRAYENN